MRKQTSNEAIVANSLVKRTPHVCTPCALLGGIENMYGYIGLRARIYLAARACAAHVLARQRGAGKKPWRMLGEDRDGA